MAHDVLYKKTTMKRIAEYCQETGETKITSVFINALSSIVTRHSSTIISPSVIVAYDNNSSNYRLFDTIEQGFDAYIKYRAEKIPCVFITTNSIIIEKQEDDNEKQI